MHCVGMPNHYARSVEHLEQVDRSQRSLARVYAAGDADRGVVAALHQDINVNLKLAGVHAQLAQVAAVENAALVK